MKEAIVQARNSVERAVYKAVAKPLFFLRDPEWIHDKVSNFGALGGSTAVTRGVLRGFFGYSHPILLQEVKGIVFPNPIGLGGGFDKKAKLTDTLDAVGFGFMEVGSITAKAYQGNPQPRLQRLPHSKALIVNYGLMNEGCDVVAERLEKKSFRFPVGINVAPTNCQESDDIDYAIKDYLQTYTRFAKIGAYTTVNVSCPNTCSDMPFMNPVNLQELLSAIDAIETKKPYFLKINPDITFEEMDHLLKVAAPHKAAGFIVGNLTKNRNNPLIKDEVPLIKGGISGMVERELTDKLLAHAYRQGKDRFTFIGLGGVFSADDAYRKIRLGASLVQLITGMIYEGPELISDINCGLVKRLKRDGFTSVSEAVGVDNK